MREEQYAIDYLKKYIETDMMYENRHYKQIELVLNLIQKQDTEINKLNKVIDRMADWLWNDDTVFGHGEFKDINTKEKIKEYFMKENK